MLYFYPLSIARFPPRPCEVFFAGVGVSLLGVVQSHLLPIFSPGLALPEIGFTQGEMILGSLALLLLVVSMASGVINRSWDDPVWGGVDPLTEETVRARLVTATEQLAAWIGHAGMPNATVSVSIDAGPRGMYVTIDTLPTGLDIPVALVTYLARQIAPEDLDARALSNAFTIPYPPRKLDARVTLHPGDLSMHRRLAHLNHLEAEGFLDTSTPATATPGRAGV